MDPQASTDAEPQDEVSEKITRATFLYMDPRNPEKKFAQCATCVHFIRDKGLCEWMSADDKIGPGYSCGFYVPGENAVGKEPLGLITAEEAGVVERQVRCENCVFFDPDTEPRKHCDLITQLNLILPGIFDMDRYVDEHGCCNAQTPGKRNPAVFGPFGPIKHGNELTGDAEVRDRKTTRDFAGYYTPEQIGKTRRITPEGFLVLEGTPIARTGEQIYAAHELDGLRPNGQGQIIVQRLPEEVFHENTLKSFEGKDFVIEHPPEGVDITNWKNHTVGHVQNVRRGSGIEDDLIVADIIVKDPMAIDYVNKHLPELSAGYDSDYEQIEPGKAIQRNILGNHVAGVKAGRAGARVAVRDHQTEEVSMAKTNGPVLRAVLTALGIKTEDATKVETALAAVATTDAAEESEGKYNELAKDMKGIKDWMAARDTRDAEEEKKRKEATDAEAEAAKKKEEKKEEAEEHEKTGDTVLEAEGPGMVVNLGKTWKGSMTGDAAAVEPVLQAVVARAEILAPGITKPTADSLKGNKGTALASFMRTALERHATADGGLANIGPFLMGDSIGTLKGERLMGVFNGAAQLARTRNNRRSTTIQARHTGDFSKPTTPADLNEINRKFWAERK